MDSVAQCINVWRTLHDKGYFKNHAHYRGWATNESFPDDLRDLVGLRHDDDVLDIGCGYGRLMRPIADHARRVTGIDIHPAPLKRARLVTLVGRSNVKVVLSDGRTMPFPDESFSLVYSISTMQHVPRSVVRGYVLEAVRVLRPGGRLMFQVTYAHDPENRQMDIDPEQEQEQSVPWTETELMEAVEGCAMNSHVRRWQEHGLLLIGEKHG